MQCPKLNFLKIFFRYFWDILKLCFYWVRFIRIYRYINIWRAFKIIFELLQNWKNGTYIYQHLERIWNNFWYFEKLKKLDIIFKILSNFWFFWNLLIRIHRYTNIWKGFEIILEQNLKSRQITTQAPILLYNCLKKMVLIVGFDKIWKRKRNVDIVRTGFLEFKCFKGRFKNSSCLEIKSFSNF